MLNELLNRAGRPDYFAWLHHIQAAAGCTRPIRLTGDLYTVEATTGRITAQRHTHDLPDTTIYKACGTRRARLCPSCARTYQADAYQLIKAGIVGGKGIPASITNHATLFATLTAPSFGPVHTRYVRRHTCTNPKRCTCRPEPCHARRDARLCAHGIDIACWQRHNDADPQLGTPLCLDCYDHDHHVIWNNHAGLLWRRTKEAAERYLAKLCRARGIPFVKHISPSGKVSYKPPVRIAHGKVAEFQRRGVVHFHAILRLDGVCEDSSAITSPPEGITLTDLTEAITWAVRSVALRTPQHPDKLEGWSITWGDADKALDLRSITLNGEGCLTDSHVAGYLAKYATKATEDTGHSSTRLNADTIDLYANEDGTHTERLVAACWHLGRTREWHGIRRWAHMLGFGGHFLTKARHYSTTFSSLRAARIDFRRTQLLQTSNFLAIRTDADEDHDLTLAVLSYVTAGWRTPGDALLANTAAAMARERTQCGRDELAHEIGSALHHSV